MGDTIDSLVSPYDRLVWQDGTLEALLASGERRRELVAYFGEAEYAVLAPLARAAWQGQQQLERDAPSAWIVPGIMGSQLGLRRAGTLPVNLLWIDPVDIQHGHLTALRLPGDRVEPFGLVAYTYLRLKLRLEAAGLRVHAFDYDWRRSAEEAGGKLAQRLDADPAGEVSLVGHSMGGLVGRHALAATRRPVRALVTLGAPHAGSFAALQALRGVYPSVRRLAQLDPVHSAEVLARDVFATFPSLLGMLPRDPDLLADDSWPDDDLRPSPALLAATRATPLPAPDARILPIAGTGFDTVTAAAKDAGGVRYALSPAGDGTVPAARAVLPGRPAWYCGVAHSELPRDAGVATAVLALLRDGDCALAAQPPAGDRERERDADIHEALLRRTCLDKLDWSTMTPEERRRFLDHLNAPLPVGP